MNLDEMSPLEIAQTLNQEDEQAVLAVRKVLPEIATAITWATESLKAGGRIIYIGAGTSGRLGVLDAVECPPTFGVSPDTVVGIIAGGERAFTIAQEGYRHWPGGQRSYPLRYLWASVCPEYWLQDCGNRM